MGFAVNMDFVVVVGDSLASCYKGRECSAEKEADGTFPYSFVVVDIHPRKESAEIEP